MAGVLAQATAPPDAGAAAETLTNAVSGPLVDAILGGVSALWPWMLVLLGISIVTSRLNLQAETGPSWTDGEGLERRDKPPTAKEVRAMYDRGEIDEDDVKMYRAERQMWQIDRAIANATDNDAMHVLVKRRWAAEDRYEKARWAQKGE